MATIIIYKDDDLPSYQEVMKLLATCSTQVEFLYNTHEHITFTLDGDDSGYADVRALFSQYSLGGDPSCPDCGHAMVDGYCIDQQRHEDSDNWPESVRSQLEYE